MKPQGLRKRSRGRRDSITTVKLATRPPSGLLWKMTCPIPLEDEFIDIIGKARRGLHLSDADLLSKTGLTAAGLSRIRSGDPQAPGIPLLAGALGLGAKALEISARKSWSPDSISMDGLAQFNTPFGNMRVNAYVCWDPATGDGVIFDSGADATGLLEFVEARSLMIRLILLTHTHADHVIDLPRVVESTGAPVWISAREPARGAQTFAEGKTFTVGSLQIETRLTTGHSVGGTTYVITGLAKPLAIVGDAMFAGSMGGGQVSYLDALETSRHNILTLAEETILAPGHGPLTTLAWEKQYNPFFAR